MRRLASSEPKKTRHKVKALSDFSAEHPNELAFKKDEIFEVDVQSNGEWWRAFKPDSASGMIPANRVEVISAAAPKPPAEPSPANLTTRPRCKVRALSDFHAGVGARELSFQSGDVIEIEEDLNELRWKGWINGKQGLVLARCVQIIAPAMYSDEQPPSQSVGGFRRTFEKLRATAAASKLAN